MRGVAVLVASSAFCLGLAALHSTWGQVGLPWPGPGTPHSTGGGGGSGPYALKASTAVQGGLQTPNIDCSATKLLVVVQTRYTGAGSLQPPEDTSSNTYTQVGPEKTDSTANAAVAIWYSINSGTTNFHWGYTPSGVQYPVLAGACFTDGGTAPAVDVSSGTSSSNSAGSITPINNGELIVAGYVPQDGGSGTPTIGSSFIITNAYPNVTGTAEGGGLAYIIQTTAAAVNPVWASSSGTGGSWIVAFK